jgi:hypothetical protein
MTPDCDHKDMQALQGAALQGMAVECVVFDHADRPKRRHLLPLMALLKPLTGGISGLAADAR